jgi:hypothetical protein
LEANLSNPLFKKLLAITEELVDSIRELSRSQSEIWKRVPFLALQADGRTGYSDQYSRAYGQGYWAIESSVRSGSYRVYVDLETGELVSAFDPRIKARDEDVLMIAMNLDQIDGASIVKELKKEGTEPVSPYYNVRKQEKWRQKMFKELKLSSSGYKRKVNPKDIAEGNSIAGLVD